MNKQNTSDLIPSKAIRPSKTKIIISFFFTILGTYSHAATFTHPTERFSLTYDEKLWKVEESTIQDPKTKTLLVLHSKTSIEKYRDTVSVVKDLAEQAPSPDPLGSYSQKSKEFLESQRFWVRQTKTIELQGKVPAIEMIATQRDMGLSYLQRVFLREKTPYLLTATTRQDQFPKMGKEIEAIFNSFSFAP